MWGLNVLCLIGVLAVCSACVTSDSDSSPVSSNYSGTREDVGTSDSKRTASEPDSDQPNEISNQTVPKKPLSEYEQFEQMLKTVPVGLRSWLREIAEGSDPDPPTLELSRARLGDVGEPTEGVEVLNVLSDAVLVISDDGQSYFVLGKYDVVSGNRIKLPLVEVTDAATYPTALGGQRTSYVLKPIEVTGLKAKARRLGTEAKRERTRRAVAERKRLEAEKAEREKQEYEDSFRTWTSGKYTTEARYNRGAPNGKIVLEKRDGTEVRIEVEKLSEEDQAYVKAEQDRRRKQKKAERD